jgi:hypothetical protein
MVQRPFKRLRLSVRKATLDTNATLDTRGTVEMRKIAGAVLGLGLVLGGASCGVDKKATAENIVDSTEEAMGQELTEDQKDCLMRMVEEFSPDELVVLGDRTASEQLMAEFVEKKYNCIFALGS